MFGSNLVADDIRPGCLETDLEVMLKRRKE